MQTCSSCGREIGGRFAFCPHCGAELAAGAPTRERRKTVTVLFCDVTGSTSLGESVDPEALRGLLARYFKRMKAIVERHGGTVEKFIGDAVMAVFGVPVLHEDDALRAIRAAAEMRDALPELGLQARIGLTTGGRETSSWPGGCATGCRRYGRRLLSEMPGAGLEPARPRRGHLILSQARMTSFATPAVEG
jgi:predicted RNA-binding Zn-ribbon protein involved in translation (DUF1610 family)